jgi:hypothetical protein
MRRLAVLPLIAAAACGIDAVGTKLRESTPAESGIDGGATDATNDEPMDGANADSGEPTDASADAPADAGDGAALDAGPLCAPSAVGLLACFRFEGSATDESPSPLVPLSAANIGYAIGHEGQGAVFTPASPKTDLRLPHATFNTAQMTIEVWLEPASLPATGERFSIVDMEGRFGVTLQPDGTFRCRSLATTKKAAIGKWIHLACVNDGTTMSAYVDGKIDTSVANVLGTTSDFIGVGEDSTSTNDTFDGMMDNLRIWTRGLTAPEVAAAAAR